MKRVLLFPLLLVALSGVALARPMVYPDGTRLGWMAITAPDANKPWVRANLVQGVGVRQLAQGLGHWPETPMPGLGGRAVFSGHRTTYGAWLYDLDKFPKGTVLRLYMNRPSNRAFCYKLGSTRIVREDDTSLAYADRSGESVLTIACHPKGSRTHRIVGIWWKSNCSAD